MEIHAHEELKDLIPKVESGLEKTLQERKDLGLSVPENFNTFVRFYNIQNSTAYAEPASPNHILGINVALLASEYLEKEDRGKLSRIIRYFDIVREFTMSNDEIWTFSIIGSPEKSINEFEKRIIGKDNLEEYQNIFAERGTSYHSYKEFAIKYASHVKGLIEELLPKIKTAFNSLNLLTLRHEIDHIDFFDSPIHIAYDLKSRKSTELFRGLNEASVEYARANIEYLESLTEFLPLAEVRALFFNYIEPQGWGHANFGEVKKNIYDTFVAGYVERQSLENTLDKLISVKWSEGRMDKQTSNYLFKEVLASIKNPNAERYVVDESQVNHVIADQILKQELTSWQAKFAANCQLAVEAIGHAYQHNPSALSKANKAKTFKEYIELCQA